MKTTQNISYVKFRERSNKFEKFLLQFSFKQVTKVLRANSLLWYYFSIQSVFIELASKDEKILRFPKDKVQFRP